MAVKLLTQSGGRLYIPTPPNLKPNLTTAARGIYRVFFIRLPWSPASTLQSFVLGHDGGNNGTYAAGEKDHHFQISGPSAGVRNRITTKVAAGGSQNGWVTADQVWSAAPELARGIMGERRHFVMVEGTVFDGTSYKMFRGYSDGGFTAAQAFMGPALSAAASTYVTTVAQFQSQVFSRVMASVPEMEIEHVAVVSGNFPLTGGEINTTWLSDLVNGTKNYDDLVEASGTGASKMAHWPLINDFNDIGPNGYNMTMDGVVDICGVLHKPMAPLSIDRWQDGEDVNFWPGDVFDLCPEVTGSYIGAAPSALQYQVVDADTLAPLPGFDWQDAGATISAGNWSFTMEARPTANQDGVYYDIGVREAANPSNVTYMGRRIIMALALTGAHQSQGELIYSDTGPLPATLAQLTDTQHTYALAIVSAQGTIRTQSDGGGGGAYSRCSMKLFKIQAGKDADRAGLVAFAVEWQKHNPNRPVIHCNSGWSGVGIASHWEPERLAWVNGTAKTKPPGSPIGTPLWWLWGDNVHLPGVADGQDSGVMTYFALILHRGIDGSLTNWGTNDASNPSVWPTNMGNFHDYLVSRFFTRTPNAKTLIIPFGRYNATSAYNLRAAQYAAAISDPRYDLLAFMHDIQMDVSGSAQSPHPRHGTDGTGVNGEVTDEGVQRQARRHARGLSRWLNPSLHALGPRPSAFWRDSTNPKIAWLDTGWSAGLKTQSGDGKVLDIFVSLDGGATFALNSNGASGNGDATGGFTATIDSSHPSRIKLTQATDWPASGMAVDVQRSPIFPGGAGVYNESDAAAEPRVITMLNRLPYGITSEGPDGDRGILVRPVMGTGLAQSAPPAPNKYKLKMTDRGAVDHEGLTVVVRDGDGNIVASRPMSVTPPAEPDFLSVTPGEGFSSVTATPAATGLDGAIGKTTIPSVIWDTPGYFDFDGSVVVGVKGLHRPSAAEAALGVDNNIVAVEYIVNGGEPVLVEQEGVNPDHGTLSWGIRLNAWDFADGLVEVRAIVHMSTGQPLVMQGIDARNHAHSLFLNANYGHTLFDYTVNVSNSGSDTADGLTPATAKKTISAAKNAGLAASGGNVGGVRIQLQAGNYAIGDAVENYNRTAGNRWLTIEPAPGVAREDVIVNIPQFGTSGLRVGKVRLRNLTLDSVTLSTNSTLDPHLWCEDCTYAGPGQQVPHGGIRGSGWSVFYWTGQWDGETPGLPGEYINCQLGPRPSFIRNARIAGIGENALGSLKRAINVDIEDIDRGPWNGTGGYAQWHPDVWERSVTAPGTVGGLLYGVRATKNIKAQGFFSNENESCYIQDFGLIDCEFESTGFVTSQHGGPQKNVTHLRTAFAGTVSHRIDLKFSAEDVTYVNCTTTLPVTNRNVPGISYLGGNL